MGLEDECIIYDKPKHISIIKGCQYPICLKSRRDVNIAAKIDCEWCGAISMFLHTNFPVGFYKNCTYKSDNEELLKEISEEIGEVTEFD